MSQDSTQAQSEDCGDLDIDFKYEILPDDFLQYDLSFKIIVIGDSGVGKSCLTNRATTNLFEDTYNATVGFEFLSFNVKINEKVIKLQIWDTCGQELYRSLITNFYRNSSLAIIVYAINFKDSFENIEMWLRELRTHSNPDAKVFLIGNKVDLENERKITKEQG
jgi:small GTP-binding protein